MKNKKTKNKKELLSEISELHRQIAELEASENKLKQTEESIQTSLQRFYTVLSSMNTGLLLVTDEDRVEFANQAIWDYFEVAESPADIIGLTSSEVLSKFRYAYLHPDESIVRIKEIVDRGEPVKGEEVPMRIGRQLLRDFIPIQINVKSYGRLWHHADITERKQAEEAFKRAYEELELRVKERTTELQRQAGLLDLVSNAIILCGLGGRIRFWSHGARDIYGFTKDEAEGITSPTHCSLMEEGTGLPTD